MVEISQRPQSKPVVPDAERNIDTSTSSNSFPQSARAISDEALLETARAAGAENNPSLTKGGGKVGEFLHNHSAVNQIITVNRTNDTFRLVNDFTSNGSRSGDHKEVSSLAPGRATSKQADTDLILPINKNTVFIIQGKSGEEISQPGEAVRTSGRGTVTITEVNSNVYEVSIKKGVTPGGLSLMANPANDPYSPFKEATGMDSWIKTFK